MGPREITETLKHLIPTGRPLYLWSPPGCGKSTLVHGAGRALGVQLVDLRAVLLDPVDLRGLPCINNGEAHWCPPSFLPREGRGILFLDELAQAPPMVQAACLQLTLDRRVGEYILPEGWTVVAASNRQEDRAGTHRLISPLLNRFIHLDLEVSHEDWNAWAIQSNIATEVQAFMRFRSDLLFNFDPSANARAFPTPRSWEFASQVLPHTPAKLLHSVIAGCVGDGAAAEFVGFVRVYRSLPDIDKVLRSPESSAIPTEPSVLWATCGALVERVRKGDQKVMEAACRYFNRMPEEYSVLGMRDSLIANSEMSKNPFAKDLIRNHKEVLGVKVR